MATQDNDPLPFLTIAACTRNVIEFLESTKQREEDRAHEGERDRQNEQENKSRSDYIAERVREIERFEDRARGLIQQRSRRQRP